MKRRFALWLSLCCIAASISIPCHALEYTFDAPDAGLFGRPTSVEVVSVPVGAEVNIDRSKNVAYIPPAFGSQTSYTMFGWDRLTPNLIAGSTGSVSGSMGSVTVVPPVGSVSKPSQDIGAGNKYTSVTDDLYYSAGHIGTLKIPDLGLTVKVYEGTDSTTLAKGAGHFESTSFFNGNTAIAAHNRGVANHFGKIHTLDLGDTIKLTTKLGTKTYEVYSVSKIRSDDFSVLNDSRDDIITLITCVWDQPDYRWCVQAIAD